MQIVSSGGVALAADVVGDGKPVSVVAHGLTGSRHDLAMLAPFIPGTKVLFDFRGHGDSDRPPPGSYSMDAFAADLDHAAAAYGATVFVGVSLGVAAALRLLRSRPDRFERLVLVLPARLRREDPGARTLLRMAEVLERMPVDRAADVLLREEAGGGLDLMPAWADRRRETILRMNSDSIPTAIREVFADVPPGDDEDLHASLRRVTAPALVVGNGRDLIHRADVARELAAALPNAELVEYDDPLSMLRDIAGLTQRVASFVAG